MAVVAGTAYLIWRDVQQPPESAPVGTQTTVKPARGGRLVVTARAEPRTFNRIVNQAALTGVVADLTLGRLVRVNRTTRQVEPWLAERWVAGDDGRTFTLTLRDGVTWSDGTPFTAEDVLFTFKAVFDPAVHSVLASSLSVNGSPITAEALDARTVRIVYPAPFGPGLRLLDNLIVVPKHKLEAALEAGTFAQAWGAAASPGEMAAIGPFMLDRYEPGQRLVFVRNPSYWRRADDGVQLPYLDELSMEIVPDQSTELLRLQAGESDMMQQALRAEDLGALKPQIDQGRAQLVELGVSTDPDVLFLNLREGYWAKDPRRAWVTRAELRQAISHAVDREAMAESVFLGAAVPVWGPVTSGNADWFSPNVPRYPFSLDKAKALLEGIGLVNRDGDPWLEDSAGNEARLSVLTYQANQVMVREANFIRDALAQVGVALDVVGLEQNTLVDRMLKGSFEAILFGYNQTDLDPALNRDFWLSSGAAHLWNMSQAVPATAWEKEIDGLMAKQAAATDVEERKRLFAEVQRIFGEQLPTLYFVAPRLYMGVSARTHNLSPSVLRPQLLWAADSIAVKP